MDEWLQNLFAMNEMIKTEELEEKTFLLPFFHHNLHMKYSESDPGTLRWESGDSSPGLWLGDGRKLCFWRLKMDATVPPKWYLSTRLQNATFQMIVNHIYTWFTLCYCEQVLEYGESYKIRNFNICTFHLGFKAKMMTLSGGDTRERGKGMNI